MQLEEARSTHEHAQKTAQDHHDAIQVKAHAFQQEQEDIDGRLLLATQSDSSEDAVQRFEKIMERLRKLDLATGYVALLQEVDALRCVIRVAFEENTGYTEEVVAGSSLFHTWENQTTSH